MFSSLSVVAITTAFYLLSYGARSLRRKLLQKETIVADVPFLGHARQKDHKIKGTAVVCGGR